MPDLVTGATGLVGRALVAHLDDPFMTSRRPEQFGSDRAFMWPVNAESQQPDEPIDVVYHLAGEPVAGGRWNQARMTRIRDSRVEGTRGLVDWIASWKTKPRVLVSASAIGYYGDRGDESLHEQSDVGESFLANVCRDWEAEAMRAESLGVRVVCARIGIVLAPGGGALEKMLPPFKMGVGGPLGSGKQWMSWIHRTDLCRMIQDALAEDHWQGVVNAVAPQPVSMATFASTLGRCLGRPSLLPVPGPVLHLLLGDGARVVLDGQQVCSDRLAELGFRFRYPDLSEALVAATTTSVR